MSNYYATTQKHTLWTNALNGDIDAVQELYQREQDRLQKQKQERRKKQYWEYKDLLEALYNYTKTSGMLEFNITDLAFALCRDKSDNRMTITPQYLNCAITTIRHAINNNYYTNPMLEKLGDEYSIEFKFTDKVGTRQYFYLKIEKR